MAYVGSLSRHPFRCVLVQSPYPRRMLEGAVLGGLGQDLARPLMADVVAVHEHRHAGWVGHGRSWCRWVGKAHERPATLAALHALEGRGDVGEGDPVGDGGRKVEAAVRDVLQEARDVAARVAVAVDAADQGPREVEELERVEGDLLVLRADAHDDAGAAASYGGPGLTDRGRRTDALQRLVGAATVGEAPHLLGEIGRGDQEVGGAGGAGERLLGVRDVDGEDPPGTRQPGPSHGRQADTAETEDQHRVAGLHPGGVPRGTDAGEDRAPEQRRLLERYVVGQRHHGGRGDDDLLGHRAEPQAGLERRAVGQGAARRPGHPSMVEQSHGSPCSQCQQVPHGTAQLRTTCRPTAIPAPGPTSVTTPEAS